MQRALRIAIVVAALVLGGLLARRALRAPSSSPASAVAADLFHYQADIELGASDVAADRACGALDLTVRELDRICEGDATGLATLGERVATRTASGASARAVALDDLARLPELCFEPPSPPGMCVWAAGEIERGTGSSEAAWALLTGCPPGIAAPLFDRADAPAVRVLEFVRRRQMGSPWLRPPPRLPSQYARAVLEIASSTSHGSALGTAPGTAPRYDDAAAAEVLARAYESAPDAAKRMIVADAMSVLSNARATAIVRAACASVPTMAACAEAGLPQNVELLYDAVSYVERHPAERAHALGELEGCARAASVELVGPPASCLARLATLDWARARALAIDLDAHDDPSLAGVVSTLARFPSANDLVLALRTRQLLGAPRAVEAAPVTVASAMASYGRAWMLGPRSLTTFGHDRLARHLLRLGGLDDVEVDEVDVSGASAPQVWLGRPTRLRASSHGETFVVSTASDGDFYDLDAIVGLLNVVARLRGANVRYLVVVDPLADEVVVLGPPGELASAVAEGLLQVPGRDDLSAPTLPF